MPDHEEYIKDFDATVELLTDTRKDLDSIADDMLASETLRGKADAEALGMTQKLALLATKRAAYITRHSNGMTGPSDTAVALSFSIAADLRTVIAAANRPARILTSLTKLLDGLVGLGESAAGAAPAAAATEGSSPPPAFIPKVAHAKGPMTGLANGTQAPELKSNFNVKTSKLDADQLPATPKPSPSKKVGGKIGAKSNTLAKNTL